MQVVRDQRALSPYAGGVFVPTMGALHAGHAALIRRAADVAGADGPRRAVVVSIFVNPTQFNDPADFRRYPRDLDADLALAADAGAEVVFAPSVDLVYPEGPAVEDEAALPRVATAPGLEDRHRPGHFAGVCQVVRRLFALVLPASAIFGEKDWQQLQVIRAMQAHDARRGAPPIEILAGPTVRERDGLALSSRNAFLSGDDRGRALSIARALCDACAEADPAAAERAMAAGLAAAGLAPDYAVVRDAETLEPPRAGALRPMRALIAASVGTVRLIDNAPWPA